MPSERDLRTGSSGSFVHIDQPISANHGDPALGYGRECATCRSIVYLGWISTNYGAANFAPIGGTEENALDPSVRRSATTPNSTYRMLLREIIL
jgi:hypothetical protein